jgi:hypothetical protein
MVQDFRKLKVYQEAYGLAQELYKELIRQEGHAIGDTRQEVCCRGAD